MKSTKGNFETIVVPIDAASEAAVEESLRALRPAWVLADVTQTELIAVSIVAKPTDRSRVHDELEAQLAEYEIPVSRIVVQVNGYTIGQGLESATYGQESLVVVATRGHGRTRFLTGSVAEELVHARERQPTILIGPEVDVDAFVPCGPMVLCLDPERRSPDSERLAGQVTRQLSMEPLAVTVLPPGEPTADGTVPAVPASVREADERKVPGFPLTVLEGTNPTDAIVDYAEAVRASLITVGTRQRVGLSRLAFGSVAIETVSRAHCPVLTVPEHS